MVYPGLKELTIQEVDVFDSQSAAGRCFLGMPVREVVWFQSEHYGWVVVAYVEPPPSALVGLREQGVSPKQLVKYFSDGKAKEGL